MKSVKTFLFCSLVLVAACKKSASLDVKATLTTGKWQLSDVTIPISGALTISVYDSIPACVRDNFYIFGANDTLTVEEGATKCTPGAPATTTTGWKLLSNNTKIQGVNVTGSSDNTADIVELNSATLKLQDNIVYNGFTVVATATFKHIN